MKNNVSNLTIKEEVKKTKINKQVLKRLGGYLYYYRFNLILLLVLTILSSLFSLVGPYLTGNIINKIESRSPILDIIIIGVYMLFFYAGSSIISYIVAISMVKITQKIVYKMRKDLFDALTSVKISTFDTIQTGDIIARFSYDIDSISSSLASDVISILTNLFNISISLIMMISISYLLMLPFIIIIPLTFFITRYLGKKIRHGFRLRNESLGNINAYSEEMITGKKTIISYSVEDKAISNYEILNGKTSDLIYKAGGLSSINGPIVNSMSNLSITLVGVISGIMYLYQTISLGNLASFMLYSRKFSGPISQISQLLAEIQSGLAACERVFSYMDLKEEEKSNAPTTSMSISKNCEIDFQNLNFSYDGVNPVLNNINFKANSGEITAIVGETGSGKTTLVSILMRFYDNYEGSILINGIDLRTINKNDLRLSFSMILQDSWIFYGTIRENITYGYENVSDAELITACKNADIYNYISHLENGFETILSNDGNNISKGLKQLIIIARAFLSKDKMLILDEATSNVDTFTEVKIHNSFEKLMENRTVFVIAHRLKTIEKANKIIVLKNGLIAEIGTHKELIEKKGTYYSMFNSQFE
ncbi:MAG: ABC transporter ATP-binding protein/permease [Acholeplasmatales bacterium]|jgi:ATP-binding cassette subfamily B protein|nr:ABC transporter ATP-binding protein/permease [Acholeplasmatales bacterium]